ncbi:MAG TPA: ATP-binding cassette domain-containing protein [Candidatus Dormibacteraeota bacterium]|jgi:branched-chain amino acid transport system ATP-binding protein|nr:ATP-binding cassette domain-containing protein [Candidatus Dormibacteraeota bacterium]
MSDTALRVSDAVLRFGGIRAVDGITFDVEPATTFGVVGPNGAGKTALLNCISGVYHLQSGEVHVFGQPVTGHRPDHIAAMGVARTFQSTEHFKEFRVVDYLLLGRVNHLPASVLGSTVAWPLMERAERRERAAMMGVLEQLGLSAYAQESLAELPYGVQKRVDIARAIAAEPRLVLLDEPTSGTTSSERGPISDAIRLIAAAGVTVVMVDHDVDFVSRHCGRLLVMNFGKPIGVGTPHEMLQRADVSEAFLGVTI